MIAGIPQFFGKINHIHHLIWFMAIFAVSPCADVLSIDPDLEMIEVGDDYGVSSLAS